jgi:hypothetical protein
MRQGLEAPSAILRASAVSSEEKLGFFHLRDTEMDNLFLFPPTVTNHDGYDADAAASEDELPALTKIDWFRSSYGAKKNLSSVFYLH